MPVSLGPMERKDSMDLFGASSMVAFAAMLAINQVVIKLTNTGFGPVFAAGARSVLALGVLFVWVWIMRRKLSGLRETFWPGLLLGTLFGVEFLLLFIALDLTTVSRTTLLFYTMPIWMAVLAHLFIPGESLNPIKWLGLAVAVAGVAIVLGERLFTEAPAGDLGWLGDVLCLIGAFAWALLALTIRLTPFGKASNETQLSFQLFVSALILTQVMYKKPDLTMVLNGALAGLVSITAEPLAPTLFGALWIGAVGGVIVVLTVPMLDKFKLDDVVGAIPVHLFAGIWGTIAVVFYNSDANIVTQITGIIAYGVFTFVASLVLWFILKAAMGIRVSEEDEINGLDMSELGMEAYPEFSKG